jgi:hypothetical protein
MTVLERFAVGLIVGGFGFLIGMFAWWELYDIPGFGFLNSVRISVFLGVVCFLIGLWRPKATIDLLGLIGEKIWSFSLEVLSWCRLFR